MSNPNQKHRNVLARLFSFLARLFGDEDAQAQVASRKRKARAYRIPKQQPATPPVLQDAAQPAQLDNKALRAAAPSIFGETAASGAGKSYVHFSTLAVVDDLRKMGFTANMAWEDSRPRLGGESEKETLCHAVVMTRKQEGDKSAAALTLLNSHDRGSAFRVYASIVNPLTGLPMITDMYSRTRHMGHSIDDVLKNARGVIAPAGGVENIAVRMAEVELTPREERAFARKAAVLRLQVRYNSQTKPGDITPLLERRHPGMEGHDLWTTFSAVHENLMTQAVKVTERRLKKVSCLRDWESLSIQLWQLAVDTLLAREAVKERNAQMEDKS